VPNGGERDIRVAAQLKLQGVMAGVADLFLPRPIRRPLEDHPGPDRSGWYHGLYIEMKRIKGEKPKGEQAEFLRDMKAEGYKVVVCFGYLQAWRALEDYLGVDMPFSLVPAPRARGTRAAYINTPEEVRAAKEAIAAAKDAADAKRAKRRLAKLQNQRGFVVSGWR
jgi:hypothetical protein